MEQEQYASDLQREFVLNFYLLPNKSQDIWLRSLDTLNDIDRMLVILSDELVSKIKKHLERALINIVSKSPLHGCQLTQCKHPQVFFDAETINACLHCCKILL